MTLTKQKPIETGHFKSDIYVAGFKKWIHSDPLHHVRYESKIYLLEEVKILYFTIINYSLKFHEQEYNEWEYRYIMIYLN